MQGGVSVARPDEAHHPVDGHVQDAEQERQNPAVGRQNRAKDPHQGSEGRNHQHGPAAVRIAEPQGRHHHRHHRHPHEDEGVEPFVESLVVHSFK